MSLIWGEKFEKETEDFNSKVEAIEAKYITVFNEQINPITGKAPDKLHNQFLTTYDGYRHTIGFSKHTYVPKHIQDEVIEAFKSVFSAK